MQSSFPIRNGRHLGSLMLGLHALAWAPVPFLSSPNFRMVYVVKSVGLQWPWLIAFLTIGVLLILGATMPCRRFRLSGLGASALAWATFSLMYLPDFSYSPSFMTAMVCMIMSLTILISDVRRKPRVLDKH